MKGARLLCSGLLLGLAWTSSSCAPSGFVDPTLLSSVRILASSSDPGYAQPGQTVGLQVLAFDGRGSKPEPMAISWIPLVCDDPTNDAYYACFQQLLAQGDGGAGDGGDAGSPLSGLQPGVNLSPLLPSGPSYQFQMPADVVSRHPIVPGAQPSPYGMAVLFNIACAGHIELLPLDPGSINPVQVPLGCFDKDENQLGADDYVLGFTRIYAFPPDINDGGPYTNANPVISSIDVAGNPLAVTLSPNTTQVYTTSTFTTSRCTTSSRGSCPKIDIGPVVPPESWEPTLLTDVNDNQQHEEIWADFYCSFGQLTGSASLLYDITKGSIGGPSVTDTEFVPPNDPGNGFIWIVVHDNRGGASWVTIPVEVQ